MRKHIANHLSAATIRPSCLSNMTMTFEIMVDSEPCQYKIKRLRWTSRHSRRKKIRVFFHLNQGKMFQWNNLTVSLWILGSYSHPPRSRQSRWSSHNWCVGFIWWVLLHRHSHSHDCVFFFIPSLKMELHGPWAFLTSDLRPRVNLIACGVICRL